MPCSSGWRESSALSAASAMETAQRRTAVALDLALPARAPPQDTKQLEELMRHPMGIARPAPGGAPAGSSCSASRCLTLRLQTTPRGAVRPGRPPRPLFGHGGGRRRQPAADRRALRQRQPRRPGAEPRRAVAHAPRARRARRADGGALHLRRRGVVHRLHALQPRGAQHLLHGGRLRPRARVQPAGRHVVRGDGGDRHVPRQPHPLRLARGPRRSRRSARGW